MNSSTNNTIATVKNWTYIPMALCLLYFLKKYDTNQTDLIKNQDVLIQQVARHDEKFNALIIKQDDINANVIQVSNRVTGIETILGRRELDYINYLNGKK